MDDYTQRILQEFPQQFQTGSMIRVLVGALAHQFNDLSKALSGLQGARAIQDAIGKQLDGIGDIVVLNRAQAGLLAGKEIHFPVMDDEKYRRYLKYKILKNTSICTYEDIIQGMLMLYGIAPVYYYEDASRPATLLLTFADPGGNPADLDDVPPFKAAGVGVHLYLTRHYASSQTVYLGEHTHQTIHYHAAPIPPVNQAVSGKLYLGQAILNQSRWKVPPVAPPFQMEAAVPHLGAACAQFEHAQLTIHPMARYSYRSRSLFASQAVFEHTQYRIQGGMNDG